MTRALGGILRRVVEALRDLAPIIIVIAFFQVVVLQQPYRHIRHGSLMCLACGGRIPALQFSTGHEPRAQD